MPKYLDLDGLKTYDGKMKSLLNEGAVVGTGIDIDNIDNLNALKAQHFETQVTYNGTPYDGTLITQQSSTKSFATQLFIGWVGIVLRRTMQSGNWNSWEKIAAGTADNGIIELPNQYNGITDLGTGIYKLTYNGTKYLYYAGKTTHLVATGTSECLLLYVQKSGSVWQWHYFTSDDAGNRQITTGYTKGTGSSGSGSVSSLYFPPSTGSKGQVLQSNGNGAAPNWVTMGGAYLPIFVGGSSGMTIKGLGSITQGYKCKITYLPGAPKVYPTAVTFCFWYGSINTPVLYVDKQYATFAVTDLTFVIGDNSYLAYVLKNASDNQLSTSDITFTICGGTGQMFSMTPPSYLSIT